MYIKRDIEEKILSLTNEYSCILLTGARQVGKTTLLRKLSAEEERSYVTLDDLEARALAKKDPALFLKLYKLPILIDEVQYAPELFTYIKIYIDNGAEAGSFWLTGSEPFKLLNLSQETLAGRVAILNMPYMSSHELYNKSISYNAFIPTLENLMKRDSARPCSISELYDRIFLGSMPALSSKKYKDRDIFYSSYIRTYIERDIARNIKEKHSFLFSDFIRSLACRIGQELNLFDISKELGVKVETLKHWLGLLENSGIIYLLRPYSNNLLKRTIKSSKIYFADTGLIAYLTKYSNSEILAHGAISGAILENYAIMEVRKSYQNNGKEALMWYYRDKDRNEIDLILEYDGNLHPIEIKRSINADMRMIKSFDILRRCNERVGQGVILCAREDLSALDENIFLFPIGKI